MYIYTQRLVVPPLPRDYIYIYMYVYTYVVCVCMYMYVYTHMSMYPSPPVDVVGWVGGGVTHQTIWGEGVGREHET